jgi:hypothetical protein
MANLSVFDSEPGNDILEFYDGPSTSSSLLRSLDGSIVASQQFTYTTGASVWIPAKVHTWIAPVPLVIVTVQYLCSTCAVPVQYL